MYNEGYDSHGGTPTNRNNVKVSGMLVVKIVLAICMICFLLPFVTVSCGNTKIEATGIQAAFGTVSAPEGADELPINIFVLVALFASIASFAISFIKGKKTLLITVASGVAAVCLLLFIITFKAYYGFDKEDMMMITIDFNFAIWLSIILHGLAVLLMHTFCKDGKSDNIMPAVNRVVDNISSRSPMGASPDTPPVNIPPAEMPTVNIPPVRPDVTVRDTNIEESVENPYINIDKPDVDVNKAEVNPPVKVSEGLRSTMRTSTPETESAESDGDWFKSAGDL